MFPTSKCCGSSGLGGARDIALWQIAKCQRPDHCAKAMEYKSLLRASPVIVIVRVARNLGKSRLRRNTRCPVPRDPSPGDELYTSASRKTADRPSTMNS
eukprot:scaffold191808_cov36-Tisochrysis_lutea.AAC.3